MSVLPVPVCSVWPAGSVHHEGPRSHLGNGTEVMSSSDLRFQMWLGRKDPWVPDVHKHTQTRKHEEQKYTSWKQNESASSISAVFNYLPVIFHLPVESDREELGLLGNVSGIHDLVVLICPVQNVKEAHIRI